MSWNIINRTISINKAIQKIITIPQPIIVKAVIEADINLNFIFDLLFLGGLSKIRDMIKNIAAINNTAIIIFI